ncbi:MAG: hypothetical protein IPL12_08235 [Bacteroidetes bacterium]|nr:hypothetical protein [Bacteroidota bacterium]
MQLPNIVMRLIFGLSTALFFTCFESYGAVPDSSAVVENGVAVDSAKSGGIGAGLNGGLQLSNLLYHTSLDTGYRSPFSYVLSGQFNLTWKIFRCHSVLC